MSQRTKNIAFTVLVLACVTVAFLFRGDYAVTLGFADDVLTVDGPQGMLFTADFSDISSVKLMGEDFDKGQKLSGEEKYGYVFGEYENDGLGRYELCTQKRVERYIAVTTRDERTIIFNCENDETMENLYAAFIELLESKGLEVNT